MLKRLFRSLISRTDTPAPPAPPSDAPPSDTPIEAVATETAVATEPEPVLDAPAAVAVAEDPSDQLAEYRRLLEEERSRHTHAAAQSREDLADGHGVPTDDVDRASAAYNRTFGLQLRDRDNAILGRIDRALRKLDRGEFGLCEDCEEPISERRLRAQPTTRLCIQCQEEQEMEARASGRLRAG